MHADLALRSHLDGKRFQAGLVTIGEREVAAALRKLDCERATDAARRSRDSGRAANRRHEISRQAPNGEQQFTFFQIGTEPSSGSRFNMDYLGKAKHWEPPMRQSEPFTATALIVEDDLMQREMLCLLLEESGYQVIQCESAEAAELVLEKSAGALCLMLTDVQLAGRMNGVELAHVAKDRNPKLDVVVTSGRPLMQPLPAGAKFWAKPWAPLDVLREAEIAQLN